MYVSDRDVVCSYLLVAMDGIRPMSVPWPGRQGRSTIMPPPSVIQSGSYHGSAVFTSKLSKVISHINFIGRPFVKWFTLCYQTVACLSCPVCLSVSLVHCGQTVGWIKMKLAMQVGIGPGHIVLDGDPAPPSPKGHSPPPNFRPISVVANGCMDQDVTWYGARLRPRRLCVKWGPRSPSQKGGGGG